VEYTCEREATTSWIWGTDSAKPSNYPDFAEKIGHANSRRTAERGILICGSGVGASVAAKQAARHSGGRLP
jgi:ribose 5-phosphate isomerase RpiB